MDGGEKLLKLRNFIYKYGVMLYAITIVLAITLNMSGVKIINFKVSIVLKVLYFIILFCAMLSFYKNEKKRKASIMMIFLPFFLMFSGIPFKMITIVMVFPLFFIKGLKDGARVGGILIYLVCIMVGVMGLLIGGIGKDTVISEKYSPDGLHRVVTIDYDQGALGGDTYIRLEKVYLGVVKKNVKFIYHGKWGEKPDVIWRGNDIVNINERDINIKTDKMWENKY